MIPKALLDEALVYQTTLLKYEDGIVQRVLSILNSADKELVDKIGSYSGKGAFTAAWLQRVTEEIKVAVAAAGGKSLTTLTAELESLAKIVADKEIKMMDKGLGVGPEKDSPSAKRMEAMLHSERDGLHFNFTRPGVTQLVAIAETAPIQGDLLKNWMAKIGADKADLLTKNVRLGMVEGDTIEKLVQRLAGTKAGDYKDGVMAISRRHAEAVTRTAVNNVSNQAASLTHQANKDIIKGWRFMATLDNRTTIICASLSGRVYPVGEGPIPPRHVRCRSFALPEMKTWRELGVPIDEMPPSVRASKNGLVRSDITFDEWLKTQPRETQVDILGVTRQKLFAEGKLDLQQFTNAKGQVYTLEALKSKYPSKLEGIPVAKSKDWGPVLKGTADAPVYKDFEAPDGSKLLKLEAMKAIQVPPGPSPEEVAALDRRLKSYRSDLKRALIDGTPLPSRLSSLLADISDAERVKLLAEVDVSKAKAAALSAKKIAEAERLAAEAAAKLAVEKAAAEAAAKLAEEHAKALAAKAALDRRLASYRSDLKRALIDETPLPPRLESLLADIDEVERTKIMTEVEKAKAKLGGRPEVPATVLDFKNFEKIEDAKGSRPGGVFQNKVTGEKWYMKFPGDDVATKNELLANRLYKMMGIETPETTIVNLGDGKIGIASKWQDGLKKVSAEALSSAAGVREGFTVDAWLANWDVIGANFDNLLLKDGRGIRIDAGGALLFRAKGSLKGTAFGSDVSELKTFLEYKNPTASRVFANITRDEQLVGARKVLALTDQTIFDTLKEHGPYANASDNFALAIKLIERKQFIAKQFPEAVPGWVQPRRVLMRSVDGTLDFKYADLVAGASEARATLLMDRLKGTDEVAGLFAEKPRHIGGSWVVRYVDAANEPVLEITARLYKDESVVYTTKKIVKTSDLIPELNPKAIRNWDSNYEKHKLTPAERDKLIHLMKDASPWMRVPEGDTFEKILVDEFRGQVDLYRTFNIKKGKGMVDPVVREQFEIGVFGVSKDAPSSAHPKYGYWSDGKTGLNGPSQYGRIRVKFKPEVRTRATATIGDSLGSSSGTHNMPFKPDDPQPRVITRKDVIHDARNVHDLTHSYVEAQYYGQLTIDDIEGVYVETMDALSPKAKKLLGDKNIPIFVD